MVLNRFAGPRTSGARHLPAWTPRGVEARWAQPGLPSPHSQVLPTLAHRQLTLLQSRGKWTVVIFNHTLDEMQGRQRNCRVVSTSELTGVRAFPPRNSW